MYVQEKYHKNDYTCTIIRQNMKLRTKGYRTKARVTLSLEQKLVTDVEKLRGQIPFSAFVNRVLTDALALGIGQRVAGGETNETGK